jgi:hypothetical protein
MHGHILTISLPSMEAEHPEGFHWGDIFHLESIVFSLVPDESLQRNVWVVRERFREVSGPTVYNAYLASNPPTGNKNT